MGGEAGSMSSLRRHIPQIAVEWDLDAPASRWRQVDGTLVFADISGFTALSERLAQRGRVGAEELVETLSRIFGAMLEMARARGGSLLKFGGDALLFLFDGPGHAQRAAFAAIEMRRALREAASTPTSVGRLRLSMSIGIHSDQILLFLVGRSHRELVVSGGPANAVVAAESTANAGEIVVTPATAARLPVAAVVPRADGALLLAGRRAPPPPPDLPPERAVDAATVRGLFPDALGTVLEPGPPDPEHRNACIGFIRFSGTDAVLAESGPDALAEALDSTISAIEDALVGEGVTLLAIDIDTDGGKAFVASGVPHASEDDEARMLRAMRRICHSRLPLVVQAGTNRGHVFVAEVGTPWRAAYSAMGDTTNTAARICAKAPPGVIYAHPSVLEHSRTLFHARAAGPFSFKGKQHPLGVYEVGDEIGPRRHDPSRDLPLVGRTAELAVLRDVVEALHAGRGGVVTIAGDAGIGKSRLLREAALLAEPVPMLALRAEPYGANTPYRVARDPVRALLGIERGAVAAMARALEDGVARADPALVPFAPLFGDVAQVELAPTPEVAAIDPRFRPDRVADVVVQLLAATFRGPLLVLVEDVQWADARSAELIARIALACGSRPWLMIATGRAAGAPPIAPNAVTMELAPLEPDDIRSLVVAATEAAPLRPHAAEALVARAEGNPLFAEEMIRASRELGSVEAVPDTLHAAFAAQLDALDPVARRILRSAAVLGQSFRRVVFVEVLRGQGIVVRGRVGDTLADFLDADGPDRMRFRTAMLRDAAYDGLAYRQRSQVHLAAGEALERLSSDVESEAAALALHFGHAGDDERTWRYSLVAAERASAAYANVDAAVHYERALEAARRLPGIRDRQRARIWTSLGDVRELAAMFDESLDAYRRASRLVRHDPISRAELLLKRARARERSGRFSSALRELTVARRLLAPLDGEDAARVRARLLSFEALVRIGQERFRDALSLGREAVAAARAVGDPATLARALTTLEVAEIEVHGPGEGRYLREALDLFASLGDVPGEAQARGNLGFLAAHAGAWRESVEWLTTCQRTYERAGDTVGAAMAAANLGEMLVNQRRFDDARVALTDAARAMRASRFVEGAARVEVQLARLHVAQGDLDDADAVLAAAESVFASLGQTASLLLLAAVRAGSLVRRGSPEQALEQLTRAEQVAGAQGDGLQPIVALARASALLAVARFDEARATLDAGLEAARDRGMPYEEALLLELRIETARRSGQEPDPADAEAVEAIFDDLGVGEPVDDAIGVS
jgi:class 3 adenylate cyclase/tetratricopeptide (TPR) repeat protein